MTYTIVEDLISISFSSEDFGISLSNKTYTLTSEKTKINLSGPAVSPITFTDQLLSNDFYTLTIENVSKTIFIARPFLASSLEIISKDNKKLVIQYNPELTNLKYNYAESFTSTLGSAYPIVRRNGSQKHRTLSIGGLIAFDDENASFIDRYSISGSGYNSQALKEKAFRDEVINFLQDGQIKLLRAGAEGNMLVYISNVSLTGNKTLDRNIYSFTATATEIAECCHSNWKGV